MQHKLDINELELDHMRHCLSSIQGMITVDYISTDLSAASETYGASQYRYLDEPPLIEEVTASK